jgi:hypothetical protein
MLNVGATASSLKRRENNLLGCRRFILCNSLGSDLLHMPTRDVRIGSAKAIFVP